MVARYISNVRDRDAVGTSRYLFAQLHTFPLDRPQRYTWVGQLMAARVLAQGSNLCEICGPTRDQAQRYRQEARLQPGPIVQRPLCGMNYKLKLR